LSQERTRKTLEHVMTLPATTDRLRWLRKHVTANGLSFSRRILNPDGSENFAKSQRVEFKVRTDSESRIERIIETGAMKLRDFTNDLALTHSGRRWEQLRTASLRRSTNPTDYLRTNWKG